MKETLEKSRAERGGEKMEGVVSGDGGTKGVQNVSANQIRAVVECYKVHLPNADIALSVHNFQLVVLCIYLF